MILKLSALRVFTFGRYAQSEKTTVSFWIVSTKNVFLTALTRWLSLYPRLPNMLQIFRLYSHTSQFTSINKLSVVLKRFLENPLSEFDLRHLQSFADVFNDQVHNIEKSKASIVEVVSCFATVKARIQKRQSDAHMMISSTVNHVRTIYLGRTLQLMKLNCLTNAKTFVCSCEKRMQFIVKL